MRRVQIWLATLVDTAGWLSACASNSTNNVEITATASHAEAAVDTGGMSPDCGGIFDTLLRLARFGLGGPAGDGRQYVSWLHDEDLVRAVGWVMTPASARSAIAHDELAVGDR